MPSGGMPLADGPARFSPNAERPRLQTICLRVDPALPAQLVDLAIEARQRAFHAMPV